MKRWLGLVLCLFASACGTEAPGPQPTPSTTPVASSDGNANNNATPGTGTTLGAEPIAGADPAPLASFSAQVTSAYLSKMVQPVVGRVLNADERALIASRAGAAISPIINGWVAEPGFVSSARRFMEIGLQVSGQKGDVDFDLPGNLVEHVLTSNRPWSEVLTSESCYDAKLEPRACDTGAPFGAGVLATRAYLIARASRFNLTRSSALMKNFACQIYPQEETLQPRIDKPRLIPMFRAERPEEQPDERAKSGFGNGFACYGCHGQFSLHAQLFVKFDSVGRYIDDANGQQDPTGELGRSLNGLMASHLVDPAEAASERSNMFGQEVKDLGEAARVVAQQATFVPCAARRFLDFTLAVPFATIEYDPNLFREIADSAGPEPMFTQIVQALLTHPVVVDSVARSLGEQP